MDTPTFRSCSTQGGTRTDVLGRTFPLGQVFDPSTTRAVGSGFVRDPFPETSLPANRLDPNAIKLLNLYPGPKLPGLFNNYAANPVIRNDVNQYDVRIDHNFGDKDSIFGRVSYSDNPQIIPGPFPGIADGSAFYQGNQSATAINAVVSETHSFSPNVVNEIRAGFNRIATNRVQPFANTFGIPEQFGIQGVPQVPSNGGLGTFQISGLT